MWFNCCCCAQPVFHINGCSVGKYDSVQWNTGIIMSWHFDYMYFHSSKQSLWACDLCVQCFWTKTNVIIIVNSCLFLLWNPTEAGIWYGPITAKVSTMLWHLNIGLHLTSVGTCQQQFWVKKFIFWHFSYRETLLLTLCTCVAHQWLLHTHKKSWVALTASRAYSSWRISQ